MRKPTIVLVALVAFALGSAITFLLARHNTSASAPASTSTSAGGKQALYWYDPMKPDQHFDHPGKSPFMDMQLVPKYAGESGSSDAGTVAIDPRLTQSLGVRTARAERGTLSRSIRATGIVAFDERAITTVSSRVAGIVEQLQVRAPLTQVKRGQALATVIAPDWTAAQEDYLALHRTNGNGLDALRSAARQRLVLLGMDEGSIRALDRSGRAQLRFAIAAPRDGVVAELSVRDGASVAMGAPIMTLNGLDTVWVNAAIAEADAGVLVPGATVTATFPAFPGERFNGTIEALLPDLDAATRTQRARVVLANPQHRLAPGMFANVEVASPAPATQVLVPSESVIETGTRNVVIVAEGKGRFRAQEVRLGAQAGGKTAVLDGIKDGEDIVLSGQFLIDSEASLSGTLARLGSGEMKTDSDMKEMDMGKDKADESKVAAPEQHLATGKVVSIDGTHWSIAADAIPSLDMGAMTMGFVVPAKLATPSIRPGQRVSFSFVRNADGDFEIVKIATLDEAKGAKP
ncbi:MAG: efflux RND transporter periplasmic adaptor subunit [Rudaea sp.]|uniref:efflux RND transporter periplasmic adaptor subunit n=1 Tax=unclassified Rudaea TaxID=2627037 RepID=UPI0010F48745|nr:MULTISPECIES: efflux RND transporter periplasmic adaptor subunit [unclassified Rudaea]MBN8888471.1 efflux RND transporter periplasmic adaptor subunit [Rudaea sp.]